MSIKGAEYAVTQVSATLQLYLPTEHNLIDAEMADGITLADPEAYIEHEGPAALVPYFNAVAIDVTETEPLDIKTTTNSPGVDHSQHRIEVRYGIKDVDNEEPQITKRRVLRHARAIVRVLAIKYPTLGSTVVRTYRIDNATYREESQGEGQNVRTATIPFMVVTYENL